MTAGRVSGALATICSPMASMLDYVMGVTMISYVSPAVRRKAGGGLRGWVAVVLADLVAITAVQAAERRWAEPEVEY